MRLYIIRHAQSLNNAEEDPARWIADPELSALGIAQAVHLAQHLTAAHDRVGTNEDRHRQDPGYGITHLYCSPMRRTLQTARPVAEALGLTPEVWIDIHEHGGVGGPPSLPMDGQAVYAGLTRREMLRDFSGYRLPDEIVDRGWWRVAPEGLARVRERAEQVLAALRPRWGSDQRVALITHGAFSAALLRAVLGLPPEQTFFFHHANTGISRLDLQADGFVTLRYLNKICHLPAEWV